MSLSPEDVEETNPLVKPEGQTGTNPGTKTAETPTDNDAEAPVTTDSLVSIGDYVWFDKNRDGRQTEGEEPIAGMVVNLYDAAGVKIADTRTDDDGYYVFTDLTPGKEYVVEFVKDPGYTFTSQNSGGDDTADSDADRETGRVTVVAPASGSNSAEPGEADDPTIDAGLVRYNLTIAKTLITSGKVRPGDKVTFELVPHNDGPADALGGWSVTDLLPKGLTLKAMAGGRLQLRSGGRDLPVGGTASGRRGREPDHGHRDRRHRGRGHPAEHRLRQPVAG